jgi:hypothetical protein
MNRQRILRQRAGRGETGFCKLSDGWYVGTGRNGGACSGPHSKREAVQLAARWAMPIPKLVITITSG